MSARSRLVYENLVCALRRGRRAATSPLRGLGPSPTTSRPPAGSARLEIPRPHPHAPTPPGPSRPAPRSQSGPGCATRKNRELRPRLLTAPRSALLAPRPSPRRPVVRGRRRILHLPSVTLTTSVCAQTRGLRSLRGSRSGGLLAKRPAPAGPRRASAGGGGGRTGWPTKSRTQASAVCGCWVLSGRRGLRSATHPPPAPPADCPASYPAAGSASSGVTSGSPGKGGRGPRSRQLRAGPSASSPAPIRLLSRPRPACSSPCLLETPMVQKVKLSEFGQTLTHPKFGVLHIFVHWDAFITVLCPLSRPSKR